MHQACCTRQSLGLVLHHSVGKQSPSLLISRKMVLMRHLMKWLTLDLLCCITGVVLLCRPVEVLRKESLAGLAPSAACRVLSHAYAAVVPITPLPYPPLPLSPNTPGQPLHASHPLSQHPHTSTTQGCFEQLYLVGLPFWLLPLA